MRTTLTTLFFINIALLTTHELDAIYRHEWRIFFGRTTLSDETAYQLFTLLHIPLFAWIFWQAGQGDRWFEIVFDLFLIVHVGLHHLFRNHPAYEFNNRFSNAIIRSTGLLGLIHLGLLTITVT